MALLTVTELEGRLGYTLAGGLATQAARLIDDATAIVRQIAEGTLDTVDSPNVPAPIVTVMVSMVRRAMNNPLALSGEAIDGHQWQASGSTGVFANKWETKTIRRAVGVLGVGTVVLEGDLPIRSVFGFEDQLIDLLE